MSVKIPSNIGINMYISVECPHLAFLWPPVRNHIRAIITDHIESSLARPRVKKPPDVILLEKGTVAVVCLPVISVLRDPNIAITASMATVCGPGPLSLLISLAGVFD